jgi:hypothetical protein
MAKRKLDKLTPGQQVWQIKRQKMGNTTIKVNSLYSIKVVEIDADKRRVLMSWNGNPAKWVGEKEVSSWKLTKPEPKKTVLGTPSY